MDPRKISIKDFDYELPDERIAYHPLPERDLSKLLVYQNEQYTISDYRHLHEFLPGHSLIVFNNTKVVAARLIFRKPTGGKIEVFCIEPAVPIDVHRAMQQKGAVEWYCFVGGASKWPADLVLQQSIEYPGGSFMLSAQLLSNNGNHYTISLSWSNVSLTFAEVLHFAGKIPLPPYIKREADETDSDRYQTIFAQTEGSVAAPTAGLHFTSAVLENLQQKDIEPAYVTLHVGAGTFLPVKSDTLEDHTMHYEYIEVSADSIRLMIEKADQPVTVVGTTSLRTIESLYWMGAKLIKDPHLSSEALNVRQWDAYEMDVQNISAIAALTALLKYMEQHSMHVLIARTQLMITPGYDFKIVQGLITNFHQPQSTLLLLIAAFIGEQQWRKMYNFALENGFRFLSYGDGCYLTR